MLWVTLPSFAVAAISVENSDFIKVSGQNSIATYICVQMRACLLYTRVYMYIQGYHMRSQIQLHLTSHKIQPTADKALCNTWMSAPRHAGYLNTEMRLFTFLITSLSATKQMQDLQQRRF